MQFKYNYCISSASNCQSAKIPKTAVGLHFLSSDHILILQQLISGQHSCRVLQRTTPSSEHRRHWWRSSSINMNRFLLDSSGRMGLGSRNFLRSLGVRWDGRSLMGFPPSVSLLLGFLSWGDGWRGIQVWFGRRLGRSRASQQPLCDLWSR